MTRGELKKLFKEVMTEMSMTGGTASFSAGSGAQYGTSRAFKKRVKKTKQ